MVNGYGAGVYDWLIRVAGPREFRQIDRIGIVLHGFGEAHFAPLPEMFVGQPRKDQLE